MSTERRSAVKTYPGKKRRPGVKGGTIDESEASGGENEPTGSKNQSGKENVDGEAPDPLNLPGPEPRTKRGPPHAPKLQGKTIKPPSAIGPAVSLVSKQGFAIRDNDASFTYTTSDVSDKEGTPRSVRTTEAQRRAILESHPDVAELEPHRVRCRCCNKWLKLSGTQAYALAPWKLHKKACTSENPCTRGPRRSLGREGAPSAGGAEDDDASSVAPSVSASGATGILVSSRYRSSSERQKALEEDELTGEVRPDVVFCSACAKWVKLSSRTTYQLRNWMAHIEHVHGRTEGALVADPKGGVPSKRVREAERKLQLVNDSQARDFTASRVTCKACSADVTLSDTVPYQLDNWSAHKAACPVSVVNSAHGATSKPVSTTISTTSMASDKGTVPAAPPSTASTDITCVAPDGTADKVLAPNSFGRKRPREDDEHEDDSLKPVRARTSSSYSVPDLKPSGPWGWLKLPWETFKRGFAEGLGAGRGDESKADG